MKGIKSDKNYTQTDQLCAGFRIEWKKPNFYEYDEATGNFTETEPIEGYKSAGESKVSI